MKNQYMYFYATRGPGRSIWSRIFINGRALLLTLLACFILSGCGTMTAVGGAVTDTVNGIVTGIKKTGKGIVAIPRTAKHLAASPIATLTKPRYRLCTMAVDEVVEDSSGRRIVTGITFTFAPKNSGGCQFSRTGRVDISLPKVHSRALVMFPGDTFSLDFAAGSRPGATLTVTGLTVFNRNQATPAIPFPLAPVTPIVGSLSTIGMATIFVTVLSEDGGGFPGASCTLTDGDGQSRNYLTDRKGRFGAQGLDPGLYKIDCRYQGFETARQDETLFPGGQTVAMILYFKGDGS